MTRSNSKANLPLTTSASQLSLSQTDKKPKLAASQPNASSQSVASTTSKRSFSSSIISDHFEEDTYQYYNRFPGSVYVFGSGECGQLGLGEDVLQKKKPFRHPRFDTLQIINVSAGGMHTLALSADGRIYSWGCNDEKALGHSAEEYQVGLVDQFVTATGAPFEGDVRFIDIASGDSISAAVSTDGQLYAWGTFRDSSGVLGYDYKGNIKEFPGPIMALSKVKVKKVYAGANHLVAICADHSAYAWGCGEQGQLGRKIVSRHKLLSLKPQPIVPKRKKCADGSPCYYVKFSCGAYHTLGLTNDGSIYAWGLNNHGQLGLGDKFDRPNAVPLDLTCFGGFSVVDLAAGEHHSVVATSDGSVYTFGRGDSFQLGVQNPPEHSSLPIKVAGLSGIKKVAAGGNHCIAIDASGSVYVWGFGEIGQLGTGKEEDEAVPVKLLGLQGEVLKASAGGQHSVLLIKLPQSE